MVEGYASEKKTLDESVKSLEDGKELLIVELEHAKARLHELEESHQDIKAREDELQRQRQALEDSISSEEKGTVLTVSGHTLVLDRAYDRQSSLISASHSKVLHSEGCRYRFYL